MKIVALTGLPRSGKDTAALWFTSRGYTRLSFAAPLKEAAAALLGRPVWQMNGEDFDREKILPEWGFSTRWFLQILGTECVRNHFGPDFWVKRMAAAIREVHPAPVVITDCRFENEAAMVRAMGGVVIGIWRPGVVGSGHVSDKGVTVDCAIPNDGTIEDLYAAIAATMLNYAQASRRPAAE